MNIYLTGLICVLFSDALVCYAVKRRFSLLYSVPCAILWPVTVPMLIVAIAVFTRNFPRITS